MGLGFVGILNTIIGGLYVSFELCFCYRVWDLGFRVWLKAASLNLRVLWFSLAGADRWSAEVP